jgi:hypothetical protein
MRKEVWVACVGEHVLVTVFDLCLIVEVAVSSPNKCRQSPSRPEQFIHQGTKMVYFVIVNRDEDDTILIQKLLQQHQAWVHHRQPAIVPVQRFAFLADHLAQPAANLWAVHVVVVDPALIAGVVRRVDVDALHLPGITG